ncbi:MAG: dihydrolipoamide acetyltransferase family protein, partial [Solirubrobacteraceae bacterium]
SVAVGAVIAVVGARGEDGGAAAPPVPAAASAAAAAPVPAAAPAPAVAQAPAAAPAHPIAAAAARTRVKASPLARRIAAELGVDLRTLAGSGPQGRVIKSDVERSVRDGNGAGAAIPDVQPDLQDAARAPEPRALPELRAVPAQAPAQAGASVPATAADGVKGEVTRHALSHVQRTIARRMAQSRATVPDFELRCEVDMSRAVALREQLREISDPPPSYNDLLVKAAATALREFPRVNGSYRDETFEEYGRVNVGIAVAAPDALVVPTIFDADRLSLSEIAAVSRALAAKVRDGTVSPAELGGSTFSISNLGMYGIDSFSAVVNPPQAAILAVGSLRRRPVVDESSGEVVARETIELTLACDHRILYGADAARFLARVRELLERPLAMLV